MKPAPHALVDYWVPLTFKALRSLHHTVEQDLSAWAFDQSKINDLWGQVVRALVPAMKNPVLRNARKVHVAYDFSSDRFRIGLV